MRRIIDTLGEVYRDDGIAIWLAAEHTAGPLATHRPIELCATAAGRERVLAAVEILTTGAFA